MTWVPVTEGKPALPIGQALEALLYPQVPFTGDCSIAQGGVGCYPGTGWLSWDPGRVCALGTQGNCSEHSDVKGLQNCSGAIPTWPVRIWRIR